MKRWKKLILFVLAAGLVAWGLSALFVVEATETAIVARFSRPLETVYTPGLHLKAPWPVDEVYRFNKQILAYDHVPTEFLTKDKKNILIDSFAVWRIEDEHRYLAKVRNRDIAEVLLLEMITSSLGEVVGSYNLSAFINADPAQVKLAEINSKLAESCRAAARENYGMEVLDVRINMFNFPQQNRESVIRRMQAERSRIATKYRSEGEEEALKVEASTEKETRTILAEARRDAEIIRGRGEADAMTIYAEAYEKDPEFYEFLRTLEAYEKVLDADTTLIMKGDTRLWKVMEEGAP